MRDRRATAKVPLRTFLEMTRGISSEKRYALVNQEVIGGFVYFRDAARKKLIKEILDYHQNGLLPPVVAEKRAARKANDGDFHIMDHIESLQDVRGPDGEGWHTSRCPSCAHMGGDGDSNHFRFLENGGFHCFKGCTFVEIRDVLIMQGVKV
tara:strand:+ start:245 stop:700 length:456 start_codon:yes stop_codon:yes gene_type:complete